jgi:hypothetical protein
VPTLEASARRRGRALPAEIRDLMPNHVDALSNLIPWDSLTRHHHTLSGVVPDTFRSYLGIVRRWALKSQNSDQRMHVAFFPETPSGLGERNHYAAINLDCSFTATLPEGRYQAALARRDTFTVPYNTFRVVIPATA